MALGKLTAAALCFVAVAGSSTLNSSQLHPAGLLLGGEDFSEELILQPLWDGSVLARFTFTTRLKRKNNTAPNSEKPGTATGHSTDGLLSSVGYDLFPKSISQIVHKHSLVELHVSLTRGRWLYDRWGELAEAAPPGAEVLAWQASPGHSSGSAADDVVDGQWTRLSHALAGTLCASLNTLATTSATLAASPFDRSPISRLLHSAPLRNGSHGRLPVLLREIRNNFDQDGDLIESSKQSLRYGVLPQEAVCTENLTPWLKLLPCGDKEGLATLLRSRQRLFSARFQSLQLRVLNHRLRGTLDTTAWRQPACATPGSDLELRQSLVLVLDPLPGISSVSGGASFKLSELFRDQSPSNDAERRQTKGSSQRNPTDKPPSMARCCVASTSKLFVDIDGRLAQSLRTESLPPWGAIIGHSVDDTDAAFSVEPQPAGVARLASGRLRMDYSSLLSGGVDSGVDLVFEWREGAKALPMKASLPVGIQRSLGSSVGPEGSISFEIYRTLGSPASALGLCLLQNFPWFIQLYMQTYRLVVDSRVLAIADDKHIVDFVPASGPTSSSQLEVCFIMDAHINSSQISIDFQKKFLSIYDFPADANRGFDIPAAVLAPLYDHWEVSSFQTDRERCYGEKDSAPIYSQTSILRMPMPDFSMPYNVVALSCTVLSVFVASTLGTLLRRFDMNEDRRPPMTKLIDGVGAAVRKVKAVLCAARTRQSPGDAKAG